MNGQKLILKVRKLLNKEGGEEGPKYEAVLPHVWKFEDTVLLCALDRRPPAVADMECAALDLVDAVEMTVAVRISACWDGHRAKLDLCKSAAPPGDLTDSVQLVKEMGFKPGSTIQRRKDKLAATIGSMGGDTVVLQLDEGLFQLSCKSFLHNEWKIIKRQVDLSNMGLSNSAITVALRMLTCSIW